MKPRDILTLLGALLLAIGPVLMHHVDSQTVYLIGEICLAIGPVLMGFRAVLDGKPADNNASSANAGTSKLPLWIAAALLTSALFGLAGCQQVPNTPYYISGVSGTTSVDASKGGGFNGAGGTISLQFSPNPYYPLPQQKGLAK